MKSTESKSMIAQEQTREQYLCQHHELQILFDITNALHGSPHLKDVLQQSLMAFLRTLKFKLGAIYLVKEALEKEWVLEVVAHHGFSSTLVHSIHTLSLPAELMEKLHVRRKALWFPLEGLFFDDLRQRMSTEGITEIICIPLMSHKRVTGLLYVTNDGALQLRPERSEFLTTIGHQIGVAIENAQLFDSIVKGKNELEISFDAIQHSIFIIDSRWRILRVNKTSEQVYGTAKDLIGSEYTQVLYGQAEPYPGCPIVRCLEQAQPVQREGAHPRWGGVYHFYAFPVLNASGDLERVVYYEKDETEAKKLEQRMQQSERLKALGTLAAGIAHEIRNPLATINFNTQMLQRELSLDGAQQQMFNDMVQEVRKIDRIVQQVLHFAKPRDPQFLPIQLNEIVRYCFDLSKVYLRKASVEVTMDLAEDLPAIVMDFNQISQVIMNLVINAIEAMPDGGRLSLKTTYQTSPVALVLIVSDTGPGILEEDRNRIFDPFFTRKSEGTGLGLSISRQIIEKHGAYLDLDTAPGKGATFRITFPLIAKGRRRVENSDASTIIRQHKANHN